MKKEFGYVFFALLMVVCVLVTSCAPPPMSPEISSGSQQPVAVPMSVDPSTGDNAVVCYQNGQKFNFGNAKSDLTLKYLNFVDPEHLIKDAPLPIAWTWINSEGKREYLTNASLWSCKIVK